MTTGDRPVGNAVAVDRRADGRREPRHAHDCTACVFLGSWIDQSTPQAWPMDLYVHLVPPGVSGGQLIARFADEEVGAECYADYVACIDALPELAHPALIEARRRLASRMVVS